MIYIDTSFYLSLLNSKDSNHKKAIKISKRLGKEQLVTSQIILGEVLTVGSMCLDKNLTIKFVEKIFESNTQIILEKAELVEQAFKFFKQIESKNISWADCFSFAVIKKMKIDKVLSFDKDFKKYEKLYK